MAGTSGKIILTYRMIECDGIDRTETIEIILVRVVVAVPGYHVKGGVVLGVVLELRYAFILQPLFPLTCWAANNFP